MISERKQKANERNAKKSTGPKNTSATRFNPVSHALSSREAFISSGPGKEDISQYEALRDATRADFAPVGNEEEFLVDKLIELKWRMRRIPIFETAEIERRKDSIVVEWEEEGKKQHKPFQKLLDGINELTKSLESKDSAEAHSGVVIELLMIAKEMGISHEAKTTLEEQLAALFQLYQSKPSFHMLDQVHVPIDQIMPLVLAISEKLGIDQNQFLQIFRKRILSQIEGARSGLLEWLLRLASLPDDEAQAKVQRYETHYWRLYIKVLDQLERRQGARSHV